METTKLYIYRYIQIKCRVDMIPSHKSTLTLQCLVVTKDRT